MVVNKRVPNELKLIRERLGVVLQLVKDNNLPIIDRIESSIINIKEAENILEEPNEEPVGPELV